MTKPDAHRREMVAAIVLSGLLASNRQYYNCFDDVINDAIRYADTLLFYALNEEDTHVADDHTSHGE